MPGDATRRWIAGLATVVIAAVVTYRSFEWADPYPAGPLPPEVVGFLERAEDSLGDTGYGVVAFCLTVVLVGAVLQIPAAVRRRADIGRGLLVVLGLVAFMLVVVWLATLLTGAAPELTSSIGRRSPGSLYGAALLCLVGTPALLVVGGGVFVPRRSGGLGCTIALAGLISGMVAVACLAVLGAGSLARTPELRVWSPPGGGGFLFIGAVAAGGLSVLAVAVGVSGRLDRGLPATAMRKQGAGALALAGVAGYFAVTGLLGAQLGWLLPGWLVPLLAAGWLLASVRGVAWFFAAISRRAGRRPAGDDAPPGRLAPSDAST